MNFYFSLNYMGTVNFTMHLSLFIHLMPFRGILAFGFLWYSFHNDNFFWLDLYM